MARRLLGIVALACGFGSVSACGGDDDSGSGAGTSSQGNVRFAEVCSAEAPCGGDPTGQWKLRSACARPPDGGFQCAGGLAQASGTITGTIGFSGGSYNMKLDADLRQCGWIDSGGDLAGGSYTVTGSTLNFGGIRDTEFCVNAGVLTIVDPNANYPDMTVLEFVPAG